jgi:hypothetical protein
MKMVKPSEMRVIDGDELRNLIRRCFPEFGSISDGVDEAIVRLRPYLRSTEPVMVDFGKCVQHLADYRQGLGSYPSQETTAYAQIVLEAAGVKYE